MLNALFFFLLKPFFESFASHYTNLNFVEMNYRSYNPFGVLNILDITKSGSISWPEMFVYQNGKKTSALYQGVSSSADMEAKIVSLGGYRNFFVLLVIYFEIFYLLSYSNYKKNKIYREMRYFTDELRNLWNQNLKYFL